MPSEPNPPPAYERALKTWLEAAARSRLPFEDGGFEALPDGFEFLSTKVEAAFREWRRQGALWVGAKR